MEELKQSQQNQQVFQEQAQQLFDQGLLMQNPNGQWRAVASIEEQQQLLAEREEEQRRAEQMQQQMNQ